MFTGSPSFNHVRDGLGMPLAMHCKATGLYFTTALSEKPEDLIVGGTRLKRGRKQDREKEGRKGGREQESTISGVKHKSVCKHLKLYKFKKGKSAL